MVRFVGNPSTFIQMGNFCFELWTDFVVLVKFDFLECGCFEFEVAAWFVFRWEIIAGNQSNVACV